MRILLLEPFFTGSHASWAQEYQQHSSCDIQLLTLPGKHWKWRMHGAAISLAERCNALPEPPDLMLASDMLDIATFRGLLAEPFRSTPIALYFHENQLTYPRSQHDTDLLLQRDNHYGFINYTSALAADRVFFNSRFHLLSFFEALLPFLRMFPDQRELHLVDKVRAKSETLPLGMDLRALDAFREDIPPTQSTRIILWNHRWEHDKNPGSFFQALFQLQAAGIPFRLVVLGESFARKPDVFDQAQAQLAPQIIHWGTADANTYRKWLWKADLLPVTSLHDFFGRSVVEAIHCASLPLLPHRLAYPEHIPEALRDICLYDDESDLFQRMSHWLQAETMPDTKLLRSHILQYDWQEIAPLYDARFQQMRKTASL